MSGELYLLPEVESLVRDVTRASEQLGTEAILAAVRAAPASDAGWEASAGACFRGRTDTVNVPSLPICVCA